MAKDFRFGMSVRFFKSRSRLQDLAKRAEDAGFDIVCVPDHLGAAAPIPTLTAVALATTKLKLSMYVLNSAFYKPALLSRDLQALEVLSDGRLEIGLGTGYVREEFDAAELPYPSARARVDYLEHMATYLKEHHPNSPILIAGNGDRVLSIAAQHADLIGLTGSKVKDVEDPMAERVEFVRNAAGERFDSLELNLAITAMPAVGETRTRLEVDAHVRPGFVRRGNTGPAFGAHRIAQRDGRHPVGLPRKVRADLLYRAGQPHRELLQGHRGAALIGEAPTGRC